MRRLPCPWLRTSSRTPPCHSRTARSVRAAAPAMPGAVVSSSSSRPAGSARQAVPACSAAASAADRTSASTPVSRPRPARRPARGLPCTAAVTRSRTRPTFASSDRISSPVPTNSCQRASTSPRSSEPSLLRLVDVRAAPRRRPRRPLAAARPTASACASAAAASTRTRAPRERTRTVEGVPHHGGAQRRVGRQAVQPGPHRLDRPRAGAGRRRSSARATTNSGAPPSPCSVSIAARCARTSSVRLRGPGPGRPRRPCPGSPPRAGTSHGTASA